MYVVIQQMERELYGTVSTVSEKKDASALLCLFFTEILLKRLQIHLYEIGRELNTNLPICTLETYFSKLQVQKFKLNSTIAGNNDADDF
jgi:hypothetical protein